MKWRIQIDVLRPGGGVTIYTASLSQPRAPKLDEPLKVSGLTFRVCFVRQTDVSEWQVICRTKVETAAQVRAVSQAMKDAEFTVTRSFRR